MSPRFLILAPAGFFLCSCEKSEPAPVAEVLPAPPVEERAAEPAPVYWSEVKVHEVIRAANPSYTGNGQFQIDQQGQVQAIALDNCGVTDISPFRGMNLMALYLLGCAVPDISALHGMPLVELYLENTAVKDLSPLKGMQDLRKLYLSGTAVEDLSPLKGLAIVEMNLLGTRVTDLSPLEGMPLQMLWLTDTAVSDISPLAKSPLVSLTLHRTQVADLSPLSGTALLRLHIGECPVTDLTPLRGMSLTRLVFDPDKITKGMDVLKAMPSLQELGSKFEDGANDLAPPAVFFSGRGDAVPAP